MFNQNWMHAFELAQQGVAVFPCRHVDSAEGLQKSPLVDAWRESATTNADVIRHWAYTYPDALIGTPTGRKFWVLDFDKEPGLSWFTQNQHKFNAARIQQTQRGFHLYFAPGDRCPTNSEGALPKGVNVRGEGGYVIAWDAHGRPAQGAARNALNLAPEWLLDTVARGGGPGVELAGDPLASFHPLVGLSVADMQALLEPITPDIGRDNWLHVLMAMHHESNASAEALALAIDWSSKSLKYREGEIEYYWDKFKLVREKIVGANWLKKFSQECAHQKVLLEIQQPVAPILDISKLFEDTPPPAPPLPRFTFMPAEQFMFGPPLRWHIKGVLPRAPLSMIYGASGSGKTFFATDMLMHIAEGRAWRGHRVNKGRCAVVVGEGANGYRMRLQAFKKHNGYLPDIHFTADQPNLFSGKNAQGVEDFRSIAAQIIAIGGLDLVMIDTLSACSAGADENKGEDMTIVLTHCMWLHKQTGASILLIHHTGKDPTKGSRGWSGLKAPLDCEIEIAKVDKENKADKRRIATITKMKDGQDEAQYGFELATVSLGVDEDMDEITSCVVSPLDAAQVESKNPPKKPKPPKLHDSGMPALVLAGIREHPAGLFEGLTLDVAVSYIAAKLPQPTQEKDYRKRNVERAINSLIAKGLLLYENGKLALA